MTCPHCKTDIPQTSQFCSHCGYRLSVATHSAGTLSSAVGQGTFTDEELKQLLEINRRTVAGDEKSTVTQNDIDKLFG
jgi:hypothetical protein